MTALVEGMRIGKLRCSLKFNMVVVLLTSCMFMSGGAGLVIEYIQGAVASHVLGNSVLQFSIVIAVMLGSMGVGSKAQKMISDDNLIEKFILIEICLAVIGGYSPLFDYWAFAYTDHFQLVQYFCIASLGFLIGLEIPVVMRILQMYRNDLSENIDSTLSADYIGSMVGALIWIFVLLKYFPFTESSFLVAGSNFFIAFVTALYFIHKKKIKRKFFLLSLIFLTAFSLFYGYANNRVWDFKMEQHMYDDTIVFRSTTRYQHLVMTRNPLLDEYQFFINGNKQFSSYDEHIYHELLVLPAMSLVPHDNVLIIGGGDGMALREVLKFKDVKNVLLVDLDPEMTKFCKTNEVMRRLNNGSFRDARVVTRDSTGISAGDFYPVFMENDKENPVTRLQETEEVAQIRVMNIDADKFLENINKQKWNVVIIDLPDPSGVELSKLYSMQFFKKVKKAMSESGVLAIQSTSPGLAKESFLMIGRTLGTAGFHVEPYHENVPSFGDWGWYLGCKKEMSSKFLSKRIEDMEIVVDTRYLTKQAFERARIFGKNDLVSRRNEVNTVLHPVLVDVYLNECWKYD